MEIRNLITFTKVAEVQSLSGAAKLLGYAQSTVTMQMQQLEQELGVPLYERVGKQIRITQAGQELLTYAVPIIRMSQDALHVGQKNPEEIDGVLRLGVLDVLNGEKLAAQIAAYIAACPGVKLEVRTEHTGEVLYNMLRHNEIDFMITLDYLDRETDLIHTEDVPQQIHLFASPEHPLAGKKSLTIKKLRQYPMILGDDSLPYVQNMKRLLRESGKQEQETQQDHLHLVNIQDQAMAFRLASGNNILLAPDTAAQEYIENHKLIQLDVSLPSSQMWQQTMYHKNKWLTGAMNAWIRMSEDDMDGLEDKG